MPEIKPFRAVRYADAAHLRDLVCPPYDVISATEQHHLHERSPANAVHLELARERPDGAKRGGLGRTAGQEERYARVAHTFERWAADGILRRDEADSLYLYRQDFVTGRGERRRVAGVIGALELGPFGQASGVLPHERTMPGPIEQRLNLMRALPVNISPIYAIYRGEGALAPYVDSLENRQSDARFADDHGTLHRLWVITAPAELDMLTSALRVGPLVIADGHHRYETALAYATEQKEPGAHDAVMCFCVDADTEDLVVLPYHRALKTTVQPSELHERLTSRYPSKRVTGAGADALTSSDADHAFLWRLPGAEEILIEVADSDVVDSVGDRPRAWRDLDVVALHEAVFPQILPEGLTELRFSKDSHEIVRLVDDGGFGAGVLLQPLDAAQVVEVARSGERMPQKASYFWPKAVTGLVFRTLR